MITVDERFWHADTVVIPELSLLYYVLRTRCNLALLPENETMQPCIAIVRAENVTM